MKSSIVRGLSLGLSVLACGLAGANGWGGGTVPGSSAPYPAPYPYAPPAGTPYGIPGMLGGAAGGSDWQSAPPTAASQSTAPHYLSQPAYRPQAWSGQPAAAPYWPAPPTLGQPAAAPTPSYSMPLQPTPAGGVECSTCGPGYGVATEGHQMARLPNAPPYAALNPRTLPGSVPGSGAPAIPGAAYPSFGYPAPSASPEPPGSLPSHGMSNAPGAAMSAPWNGHAYQQAMQAPWGDGACCDSVCLPPPQRPAPIWFGGAYGLIMNRDDSNHVCYLLDSVDPNQAFLGSGQAEMNYSGGYEVRIGRTFDCGNWGLEAVFWELFPGSEQATFFAGQAVNPVISSIDYANIFVNVSDGAGGFIVDSVSNLYTDSGNIQAARVLRSWDFQNLELNMISRPICVTRNCCPPRQGCGPCGPAGFGYGPQGQYGPGLGVNGCAPAAVTTVPTRFHLGWMLGVRYFRFDDNLGLAYDVNDFVINGADPDGEFQHDIRVENSLVGVQTGLNTDYHVTPNFHLEGGTRFGIYGNNVSLRQDMFNGNGMAFFDPANPQFIATEASDTDVAFLGESRFGLGYRLGNHWRLSGGYRVVAISGVGLATQQHPLGRTSTSLFKLDDVQRNGSLILHGAYAGLEFAW